MKPDASSRPAAVAECDLDTGPPNFRRAPYRRIRARNGCAVCPAIFAHIIQVRAASVLTGTEPASVQSGSARVARSEGCGAYLVPGFDQAAFYPRSAVRIS